MVHDVGDGVLYQEGRLVWYKDITRTMQVLHRTREETSCA